MMRWCPGQRCNLAVRVFSSAVMTVKCRCGQSFCFHCGEENHAPVSCVRLAEWNEKCKNESETAHWIIAKSVLGHRAGEGKAAADPHFSVLRFRVAHAHVVALECLTVHLCVCACVCANLFQHEEVSQVRRAHREVARMQSRASMQRTIHPLARALHSVASSG